MEPAGPEAYIGLMRRFPLHRFFVLVLAGIVLAGVGGTVAQSQNRLAVFSKDTVSIVSGEKTHKFRVELALTHKQQMQGLMFRRNMAADAGMLFLYKREAPIAMWMKNTYLPLDMLFIARDGKIVKIAERTVPLSEATISSGGAVIAVLELNAGTASRLGIKAGDRVLAAALGTAR
ncbi:MAG: DUF192 domain-containing protein [Alphaproteobacteria bacterium]